jgi:anti-sigma factor ChrR (cupin superfamily)
VTSRAGRGSSVEASAAWISEDDAGLLRLCAAFIACAEARSVEGARLDSLPWSASVDGGYSELLRGARAHSGMLDEILATVPTTIAGLLAKAYAVRVHRQDPESEPVSYAALADDIIRMFEPPAGRREVRAPAAPDGIVLPMTSRQTSTGS